MQLETEFWETPDGSLQRNQKLEEVENLINARRPVLITGPTGVGKTMFLMMLSRRISHRFSIKSTGFRNYSLEESLFALDLLMEDLAKTSRDKDVVVLLDDVQVFHVDIGAVIKRIKNLKRVRSVIAVSSPIEYEFENVRNIELSFPEGKLYGLREQFIPSNRNIIELVAPRVLTFNEALIERLKKRPDDLFRITSRQFEELIADLLKGMGIEVEVTPATRDGGKDILAYMKTPMGTLLTLVETKLHNKRHPVGVSLVRTLYGTVKDHNATSGMLVTTSRFATPARQFQERHKYELSLKDYGDVVSWIMKHRT